MTVIDRLREGWQILAAGRGGETLTRSMSDVGIVDENVLLGIDPAGAHELLLPFNPEIKADETSSARGVKILVRSVRLSGRERKFVVLRCTHPDYNGVFLRFVADVVEQIPSASNPTTCALQTLATWRSIFSRVGNRSEGFLLGVFGELDELRRLVIRSPGAVKAWVGPDGRPQDFSANKFALEIKTSKSWVSDVEIHGLLQMWARPFDMLGLAVKHVVVELGGETLADVVSEILAKSTDAQLMNQKLERLCLPIETLGELNEWKFAVRDTHYYHVTADTEALTPDQMVDPKLPDGVSALTYRLSLTSPGLRRMTSVDLERFIIGLAG